MAFVAEDGTGLSNANSYVSVAVADTYAADRGQTAWAALATGAKQTALIQATDYINKNFRFKGYRVKASTQALMWPRSAVYDRDGVLLPAMPVPLQQATVEYALRASVASLQPDPTVSLVGIVTDHEEEVTGAVRERTKYAEGYRPTAMAPYPAADALLMDLIVSGHGTERG